MKDKDSNEDGNFIFLSFMFLSFQRMPIRIKHIVHRPTESEFGEIAFEVMGCVFSIHNEFGRFFDKRIYKHELARQLPGINLEVPIEVAFEDFRKLYSIDVLVRGAAAFEFKTVEAITDRHRSQQMHSQLMADLPYGKLVNLRPKQAEHEFINTPMRLDERRSFSVTADRWTDLAEPKLMEWFIAFVRDAGTCLDLGLYEDALTHRLGGEQRTEGEVEVTSAGCSLGTQKFRLISPTVAFKTTTLKDDLDSFESHARRLLVYTTLEAIQWINVSRRELTFTTIRQ